MEKEFNVTGVCIPGQHYMVDTSAWFVQQETIEHKGKTIFAVWS